MNPQGNQPSQPIPGFVPYIPPEQPSSYYPTSVPEPYREQQQIPIRENQWRGYSQTPVDMQYKPYQQPISVQQEYRIPMEPIVVTKMTHQYNNAAPMSYSNQPLGYYYPPTTMMPNGHPMPVQSEGSIPYAIPVGTPYSYTTQTNSSFPYVYMPSSASPSTENPKTNAEEQKFGEKAVKAVKSFGTTVENAYKEWFVCIIIETKFIDYNNV